MDWSNLGDQFSYDVRGRQDSGGGRKITYSQYDLPRKIVTHTGTTQFEFDELGSRARKVRSGDVDAATVYVPGLYESRTDPAGELHVFYVSGEPGVVAQVTYAGAETVRRYIVADAIGSATVVLDENGGVIEKAYYDPFGGRVDLIGKPIADPDPLTTLGFTGHEHDEDGLINMRGRIYDRRQYRFLTPDPLVANPLFGQSYNPYSYVQNNPLRYTDPTGLQSTDSSKMLTVWVIGEPRKIASDADSGTLKFDWSARFERYTDPRPQIDPSFALPLSDVRNFGKDRMQSHSVAVAQDDASALRQCDNASGMGCESPVGLIDWDYLANTPLGDWIVGNPIIAPMIPLAAVAMTFDVAFLSRGALSGQLAARIPAFTSLLSGLASVPAVRDQLARIADASVRLGQRTPGVYTFISRGGERYVGMTVDLARRLSEHVRSGKLPLANAGTLEIVEELRPGVGRALIYASEAQWIQILGRGVPLANQINSPGVGILERTFGITSTLTLP